MPSSDGSWSVNADGKRCVFSPLWPAERRLLLCVCCTPISSVTVVVLIQLSVHGLSAHGALLHLETLSVHVIKGLFQVLMIRFKILKLSKVLVVN